MKRKLLRSVSLILAVVFAAMLPVLSLANPPLFPDPAPSADIEKLTAFFHQPTATEGILNGDACYIVDIPENAVTSFGGSYNGGANTPLVADYFNYELNAWSRSFSLSFGIWVGGQDEVPGVGIINWDDWDYPVCPDLYGPLDLSGTSFYRIENRHRNSTHITSMNFDNCVNLARAQVGYQPFCTELSALDCPQLEKIAGNETAFERIAVQPAAFSEPLYVRVFGNGTICELNYDAQQGEAFTLRASESESFVGWFEGGVLVSQSPEYSVTDGASLVACFGGDANGDGAIGIADAVFALRAAIGENAPQTAAMLDIDGNGSITIADAILIARFALGI